MSGEWPPLRHASPKLPEGPRLGLLRRALGIPYRWRTAAAWPLLHRRPSAARPPAGFCPLGPASEPANGAATAARVVFLGDVLPPGRDVELEVDPALFAAVATADLVVVNCETPVGESTRTRGTRFRLDVRDLSRVFADLGIPPERAIVSVANNHAEDDGPPGMRRTLSRLEDLGCRVVGARRDAGDSPVLIADVGSLRIGVAAWTHWRNRPSHVAGVRPWTPTDILAVNWTSLAAASEVDMLVGFPHWDLEFRHYPQPETRAFARALAGRGFRLLVGHHPHVIQGAECLDDALVFYSCGNAVTNEFCARPWAGRISVVARVDLGRDGARAGVRSYFVDPFMVTRDRERVRLERFASTSAVPARLCRRFDLLFPTTGDRGAGGMLQQRAA